ncbi:MAG: 30S ribosomal protein S20 [Candidatus Howiella sp.]|jgi:small subunit ribosomal protein S20
MPNIKSAKKRVILTEKANLRNRSLRSALRTSIKKADTAIDAKASDMDANVTAAIKSIDKAAAKGILHKNTAARKKSALTVKLNKAKVS